MSGRAWIHLAQLFLVFVYTGQYVRAQNAVLTGIDESGRLHWQYPATNGRFIVEWAPTAAGPWYRGWSMLASVPATGAVEYAAAVPFFYRVVHQPCLSGTNRVSNQQIGVGNGTLTAFSGQLTLVPIVPGSLTINAGGFTFTDQGNGLLASAQLGSGLIDYGTGAWSVNLDGVPLANGTPLEAAYRYGSSDCDGSDCIVVPPEIIGVGNGSQTVFSGVLSSTPILFGSLTIAAGGFALDDNGSGILVGVGVSGSIDYYTGVWSIDLRNVPLGAGASIVAIYTTCGVP